MAAPSGQTYKYLPLASKTSIRLLQILSGPEEHIKCSLTVVDLLHDLPYDCLSYTWGDPLYHNLSAPQDIRITTNERKFPIECNDLIICVTENLRDALLQLSRRSYQHAIWIDAICINQENVLERNAQVAMMHRIYKSARRVIVWLGIDDVHTKPAIDVMGQLSSVPQERTTVELPLGLEDPELYQLLGISDIGPQQWLDFAAFLQRTWFSRMWVIQETSVAQSIVVLCGAYILRWFDITASAELLQKTRLGELLMSDVIEAIDSSVMSTRYASNVLTNPFIFENVRRKANSLTLEKLLAYSRYFKATDERDRVFAILGLWEQALEHKRVPDHLQPDYRLKVEEVYTSAAWATIREMGDLNVLSLVEDFICRELIGLPSWVPDYSVTPQAYPLTDNLRAAPGEKRWKASDGLPFTIPVQTELLLLPIDGIQVDVISTFATTEADITDHHQLKALLEILLKMLDTPYPSGCKPIEAFWRTLIKDTFRSRPAGPEARATFPSLITLWVWELETALTNIRDAIALYNPGTSPLEPLNLEFTKLSDTYTDTKALIHTLSSREEDVDGVIPTWDAIQKLIEMGKKYNDNEDNDIDAGNDEDEILRSPDEEEKKKQLDKDLDAITESFRIAYSSRRLFLTERNYIGIGAESLQKGDCVWVIAGAAVPLVLRRRGQLPASGEDGGGNWGWKLVGEAFVYGLMDGEAVLERLGEEEGVERIVLG